MGETKGRKVNTGAGVNSGARVKSDGLARLPHERDEAPDAQGIRPREDMQQAARDLEQGLVDTDLHGMRGVEKVAPAAPQQARPKTDPRPRRHPPKAGT